MEIILLFLILLLTGFIMRGLFDAKWRASAQAKIDSIKNEKTFWALMNGNYGVELDAEGVFEMYLIKVTQGKISVGALVSAKATGQSNLIKNVIKKKFNPFKNIRLLNYAIEEREKITNDYLINHHMNFSETEIRDSFEGFEKSSFALAKASEHYDRFVPVQIASLTRGEKTGLSIWNALEKLARDNPLFEYYSTAEKKEDLFSQKMLQVGISAFLIDLLCKKIENKDATEMLRKSLTEWQQLHMLRWCIVDYCIGWPMGSDVIQRAMWRILYAVFL